jgi:hypothetical protein
MPEIFIRETFENKEYKEKIKKWIEDMYEISMPNAVCKFYETIK